MTIHNPIIIKCEGLNHAKGCPAAATYHPKAVAIHEARTEAREDGEWMWNVQTGDLCRDCSSELLAPLMGRLNGEDSTVDGTVLRP